MPIVTVVTDTKSHQQNRLIVSRIIDSYPSGRGKYQSGASRCKKEATYNKHSGSVTKNNRSARRSRKKTRRMRRFVKRQNTNRCSHAYIHPYHRFLSYSDL